MKKMVFKLEFLSDIVLQASSNTEGNIKLLDFIPGSNFLGMVAKNYDKFDDSFNVFHSGKVRFSDAMLLIEDKKTYKMPLCFFQEKLDSTTVKNQLFSIEGLTQPKQLRSGYITDDFIKTDIEYSYTQKSAYDRKKRKSLDSSMYGYSAIKSGTKWSFSVVYDESIDKNDIELIKSSLSGTQKLGKSKTAQYGLVEIKFLKESEYKKEAKLKDEVVLYCNSRVALIDENANATYDLKYLCSGLSDKNIVYEKTQIRTIEYTPYNGVRKTKDRERLCIEKGSVIVLKDLSQEQLEEIKNGVGAYLSEGFGDILINPGFLEKQNISFKELNKKDKKEIEPTTSLAKFLNNKRKQKEDMLDLATKVAEFKNNYKEKLYKNIKPSQWGAIRAICNSNAEDKKEKIKSYISKGDRCKIEVEKKKKEKIKSYISKGVKAWDKKQIDTLLQNDIEFIKLLSIQMPKKSQMSKESK